MSTVVDTTGIKVGDPEPWPEPWADGDDAPMCLDEDDTSYTCTAPAGHTGQHVATGGESVLHVWERA